MADDRRIKRSACRQTSTQSRDTQKRERNNTNEARDREKEQRDRQKEQRDRWKADGRQAHKHRQAGSHAGRIETKLQALVYDILPSTTALFSYATGSRKLSANEQFFVGAQTAMLGVCGLL